jgi:hypothetical protein
MPDKDGLLSEAERNRIAAWLGEKGRNHACPVCGENAWAIGAHLISGKVHLGGNLGFGGPTYPQAFIVCGNCAYVRAFMATAMGILPVAPPDALAEPAAEGE